MSMFQSFIEWAKDPFGKKEINRHEAYLKDMYAVQQLTHSTSKRISQSRPPRAVGGVNIIDRSVLGTYKRARERT